MLIGVNTSDNTAIHKERALKKFNVGIVGSTGVVGQTFLQLLEERKFPVGNLKLFASDASHGKKQRFGNDQVGVEKLYEDCFKSLDFVFFSSGDFISENLAPEAVKQGATVIDNSAAFRMNPEYPLIVPEVNGELLANKPKLIANPNCSTIQLVVVLSALRKAAALESVQVASYQAVSGAGQAALDELADHTRAFPENDQTSKVFPETILMNAIPQIGSFGDDGFCTEEKKIREETRKILNLPSLKVLPFTVRIPALNSHSEAVWVTFKTPVTEQQILAALKDAPGLELATEPKSGYQTPRKASGQDPVFVGRIHSDPEDNRTWMLWIVADNLRKGAALNGIQIAEKLAELN